MTVKQTLTVIAGLLLITGTPLALAQNEQDEDDSFEKSVQTDEETVTIEVTRTAEDREDTLTYAFDTSDANLTVGATTTAPSNGDEDGALDDEDQQDQHMEISAQLHQILEYQDDDQDDRYTTSDTATSSWNVSDESDQHTEQDPDGTLEWEPLEEEEIDSDDGVSGWHIHARAEYPVDPSDPLEEQDPEGLLEEEEQGNFTVDLYTFTHEATFNGETLQPTDVLVLVGTQDYPYETEDTQLALIFETWSSEQLPDDPAQGLTADGEILGLDAGLEILWEDEAIVDDNPTDVRTDLLANSNNDQEDTPEEADNETALLVHSYPRAEEQLEHQHTPSAYLDIDDEVIADIDETPTPGFLALLASIGIAASATRRR